jgi:hypothetical protein
MGFVLSGTIASHLAPDCLMAFCMVESSIAKTSDGAAHTNMTNNTKKIAFFILILLYLTFKKQSVHITG